MIHLLALAGVVGISFSAVFVRLAALSPVTVTVFRAAYAIPPLAAIWAFGRRDDRRTTRERLLAVASGVILGIELNFWHESIALIGAALGTVLANVQVIFVAAAAWALYGERPRPGTFGVIAAVLAGVVMTSGVGRHDAYGSNPLLGVALGVLAGAGYAAFLLVFRASNRSMTRPAGPLLDSTMGTLLGGLLTAPFDPAFSFTLRFPAHGWLILLALVSQVAGWLLIANALARLPAVETSILLLGQPVGAVMWGVIFFSERLSPVQWAGASLVVGGVAVYSVRTAFAAGRIRSGLAEQ